MSVQVLTYAEWFKKQENTEGLTNSQLLQRYQEYKKGLEGATLQQGLTGDQTADKDKGVVVQPGAEGTPEDQTRRAAANQGQVDEVAAMKAAAQQAQQAQVERSQQKEQGKYAPVIFDEETRAVVDKAVKDSGKDKPLYQNTKAQKILREKFEDQLRSTDFFLESYQKEVAEYTKKYEAAVTDEEKRAIYDEFNRFKSDYEDGIKSMAKIYVKSLVKSDRIEHTRVFESESDKKKFEAEHKADIQKEGLRLRVHNKKYIGEQNVNLHHGEIVQGGGSLHQAAFGTAYDTVGSDRIADPNEVSNLTDEAALLKNEAAVRKELKRLGFDVKDDTWKNIAKALIPAAGAALGAMAFPQVVTAVATATAQVVNPVTGTVLASAEESDTDGGTFFNWKGGGTAAVAAGVLSAALFGGTEDEHVLNGTQIKKVFTPSVDGKKYYETSTFGKYNDNTKMVLAAIDALNLPDERKTEILREAAGVDSREFLSSKELIGAYMMAADEAKKVEGTKPKTLTIKPNIQEQDVPAVMEDLFEYKRETGEYWIGIAGQMYLRDGKPVTAAEADAIGRQIKKDHGFAPSSADMPDVLKLERKMTVNGVEYTLKETITRNPYTGKVVKGREVKGTRVARELSPETKKYTFTFTVKDGDREVETTEKSRDYTEAEKNDPKVMQKDMDAKKAELSQKYPEYEIVVDKKTETEAEE